MNYPEPDAAVIAAAREKFDRATAAVADTHLAHANAIIALQTCTDEKSRLLDMVSASENVGHEKFAEIEAAVTKNESSLRHIGEILSQQEEAVRQAEEGIRKSNGLAQRPRMIAAIRELHDAGLAAAAARSAAITAEKRLTTARDVITQGFGAGFPAPPALRPQQGSPWLGFRIPTATHAAALRATWGELADEALADVTESATA